MRETPRAIRKTDQLRSYPAVFLHACKNVSRHAALIITVRSPRTRVAESVAFAGEAD